MQYLLTEKEYNDLVEAKRKAEAKESNTILKLCIEVAIHKPIKFWNNKEAKPWGCYLAETENDEDAIDYCDECPVQDVCPADQRWSK